MFLRLIITLLMVSLTLKLLANPLSSTSLEVRVVLSVDWEGFSLETENIEAFNKFRNDFPNYKLIHFLNPAYFTKPDINALEVASKIRSVFRPGDEFGLHIHAFESLLRVAGVGFREHETFWGAKRSIPLGGDRGHDVPLTLFSVEELRKMIRTSLSILNQNGFYEIHSFRAGGWVAGPEVLEAIALEGIRIDSSSVSTEVVGLIAEPHQPLYRINKSLWPDQTPLRFAPYPIPTKAGVIFEYPNNIALADYIDGRAAFKLFESLVQNYFGRAQSVVFHFGFHQETAKLFLPRVRDALRRMEEFTQSYRVQLSSTTFRDLPPQLWAPTVKGAPRICAKALQ